MPRVWRIRSPNGNRIGVTYNSPRLIALRAPPGGGVPWVGRSLLPPYSLYLPGVGFDAHGSCGRMALRVSGFFGALERVLHVVNHLVGRQTVHDGTGIRVVVLQRDLR